MYSLVYTVSDFGSNQCKNQNNRELERDDCFLYSISTGLDYLYVCDVVKSDSNNNQICATYPSGCIQQIGTLAILYNFDKLNMKNEDYRVVCSINGGNFIVFFFLYSIWANFFRNK